MANNISKRGRSESRPTSDRGRSRTAPAGNRSANGDAPERKGPRPLISVFGSSRTHEGEELYSDSLWMGRLLGQNGFDVVTGGYSGVMEAVSRGAHEVGAHVKGVTMRPFGETTNTYIIEEITTRDFYARLRRLVDQVDGYVVMQGGMGTLAELTFTWQKLWLKMLPERPCVLVGRRWQRVLDCWLENLIVDPADYSCMTVADNPEQACAILRAHFSGKDVNAAVEK